MIVIIFCGCLFFKYIFLYVFNVNIGKENSYYGLFNLGYLNLNMRFDGRFLMKWKSSSGNKLIEILEKLKRNWR